MMQCMEATEFKKRPLNYTSISVVLLYVLIYVAYVYKIPLFPKMISLCLLIEDYYFAFGRKSLVNASSTSICERMTWLSTKKFI